MARRFFEGKPHARNIPDSNAMDFTHVVSKQPRVRGNTALRFVLLIGVVSFFADFTYEGSRSITGPYLAVLGASATAVGVVAGLGELLGYGLRLISGPLSERTGQFWPVTLLGYFVQMLAVPALALTRTWPAAASLIIAERVGKATRNPPRDVMLSHAARHMGYGWVFGLHEAMDQCGALLGPLLVAAVLARSNAYPGAFATLLIPALCALAVLLIARLIYPRPEDLEATALPDVRVGGLSSIFWTYLCAAALVAAGFADFSLIAFHFEKAGNVPKAWVPVFYAVAMAVSGAGSLVFGRLFDRFGVSVLVPLTVVSALATPLVFLGNFWVALLGVALWGLGMGVHESIIPAAVAVMVPARRRGSAYGIFTAGYGISWFIGSVAIGILYDVFLPALIVFSVVAEIAAVPVFLQVISRIASTGNAESNRPSKGSAQT
jgi:MFS family permease